MALRSCNRRAGNIVRGNRSMSSLCTRIERQGQNREGWQCTLDFGEPPGRTMVYLMPGIRIVPKLVTSYYR